MRERVIAVVGCAEQSQALFGEKAVAISKLKAMAMECAEADWNGDGAVPVNPISVFLAENLVRALPDSIPLPEFSPEPDGSVTLDWILSQYRVFSISVGTSNRLAYAWLDGSDKGHAVAQFDGERVPPRIVDCIAEIMHHGYSTIRTA